jgi:hypothetical protein
LFLSNLEYICFQMKKIISISLLFIYLISSIGILFNFQYCCGKLKTIELYSLAAPSALFQEKCQQADMEKDCCKSDIKIVKTENDQNKTNTLQVNYSFYPAFISYFYFSIQAVTPRAFSVPVKTYTTIKRRTHLDNCVFII